MQYLCLNTKPEWSNLKAAATICIIYLATEQLENKIQFKKQNFKLKQLAVSA